MLRLRRSEVASHQDVGKRKAGGHLHDGSADRRKAQRRIKGFGIEAGKAFEAAHTFLLGVLSASFEDCSAVAAIQPMGMGCEVADMGCAGDYLTIGWIFFRPSSAGDDLSVVLFGNIERTTAQKCGVGFCHQWEGFV